jgi:hypothetical protein
MVVVNNKATCLIATPKSVSVYMRLKCTVFAITQAQRYINVTYNIANPNWPIQVSITSSRICGSKTTFNLFTERKRNAGLHRCK